MKLSPAVRWLERDVDFETRPIEDEFGVGVVQGLDSHESGLFSYETAGGRRATGYASPIFTVKDDLECVCSTGRRCSFWLSGYYSSHERSLQARFDPSLARRPHP
ncbi:hypothetical protein C6N75_09755 [Streptomyces solincola]|uniref:Uncharacterized protein n=1 Tax=Streptomyces solincola TaxID=2100817 RepID=A0A2S9PY70_9ACTN|nr:hypothetical protein [Streptomyces solincola]PRH79359.1 hypothetical protein C6N75_09755 [Streptomyces solincola]